VITVTTADRIDQIGYRSWTPSVVMADEDNYAGKHRRPGRRSLALHRMFYTARHLVRGR
jgi:hypothetical protein